MFSNTVIKMEIVMKKKEGFYPRCKIAVFLLFCFISLCFFYEVGLAEESLPLEDASESVQKDEKKDCGESFSDKIIGSTFKIMAKTFVKTVNMDKLKSVNIAKLQKMSDDKFAKKNLKVYEFTKDLPLDLKEKYCVSDHMTRQQAIDNINSLDKKEVYALINKIPNTLIATKFRQYVNNSRQKVVDSNLVGYIKNMWSGFAGRATSDETKIKA